MVILKFVLEKPFFMSLQYVSDSFGLPTAVLIPIQDWNLLRKKHPDLDEMEGELPQWQKK
jgi:hypothetical protein